MNFEEQPMSFQEADRCYAQLRREYRAGVISKEEFDQQRMRLMVRNEQGRWWARGREAAE